MLVKLVVAGIVAFSFTGAVVAQEMMACDDKAIKMVSKEVKKAPKNTMEMAMVQLEKAKMEMKANNSKDCAVHLEKAAKLSMKP